MKSSTPGTDYLGHTAYSRTEMTGHYLDWSDQPSLYKKYAGLPETLLPRDTPEPETDSLETLYTGGEPAGRRPPTLPLLSDVLRWSYGFTARSVHGDREFFYRSAPSAGALYPAEIYLCACGVPDLADGVYQFDVSRLSVTKLRDGVFGRSAPGVTFFITGIYYRSAWKYRGRAFRYVLLDAGHLAENLVLSLKAHGIAPRVSYDFDDNAVNALLCLDTGREAALVRIDADAPDAGGGGKAPQSGTPDPPDPALLQASRVARNEVAYPAIIDIHAAGIPLPPPGAETGLPDALAGMVAEWRPLPGHPAPDSAFGFREACLHRRSRRNFTDRRQVPLDGLAPLARMVCASLSNGVRDNAVAGMLLVEKVEGLATGVHLLDPAGGGGGRIGLVSAGSRGPDMARACLDQLWLSKCALHLALVTDPPALDRAFGGRGFRYAMLNAGRAGQALYLAATSLGLGCCGIGAFYDKEAARLLGFDDQQAMLYLLGCGPVKHFM